MANATITVFESDGVTETDVEVLGFGRQAAAASKSLTLATEDKAVIDSLATKLDTLAGYVDTLETLIASTNTKLDTLDTSVGGATVATATPAPGTAPADAVVSALQYNSTPPTFTNGQTGALQADVNGNLKVAALPAGSALVGKVDHSSTGLGHGVTTVTTAGTDVVLASSTAAKWVTIQSQTDNTGWIAVGATGVDATEATGTGVLLDAGESITLPIDNLADIHIDSTVNGEGVRYTYGT